MTNLPLLSVFCLFLVSAVLFNVIMLEKEGVSILSKGIVKGIRKGNRAVLAARAADADDKTILALFNIVRNQKFQHIHQLFQKCSAFLKAHHIAADRFVVARHFLQLLNIKGIGQKTYIEY